LRSTRPVGTESWAKRRGSDLALWTQLQTKPAAQRYEIDNCFIFLAASAPRREMIWLAPKFLHSFPPSFFIARRPPRIRGMEASVLAEKSGAANRGGMPRTDARTGTIMSHLVKASTCKYSPGNAGTVGFPKRREPICPTRSNCCGANMGPLKNEG